MNDLNKLAVERRSPMSWDATQRPPRWYLWEGGFLLVARGDGEVPAHSHHAIQVTIAFDGGFAIRGAAGEWRKARGVIVRPDVEHAFNALGETGAMLFVDPESAEGVWLQGALAEDITLVPEARVQACAPALRAFWERPIEGMEVSDLIRHCIEALSPGARPCRKLDPRVATVLGTIRDSDDLRMSLEAAAGIVHLSPGRFAHLFKDELGLPFRHYMLWRKVTRAMLSMGRERTIAAAAQHGDFADAAHLTRTFSQMFGITPSALMRGDFFEIASPFRPA
jgi:AraC family transcriptional regulator